MRLDNHPKTKYRALTRPEQKQIDYSQAKNLIKDTSTDSILDQDGLKALGEAAALAEKYEVQKSSSPQTRRLTDDIQPPSMINQSQIYDDEFLEPFFDDEDDKGVSAVEDLQGVMKRVSKKAAQMVEAINACQSRMNSNYKVLKHYLQEGKKPNLEFKRQIQPVSEEFIKVADIRFGRPDAEQMYGQAEEEWQRQLHIINENKKLKHEDIGDKIKKKKDAEKMIEKAMEKKKGKKTEKQELLSK